MATYQFKCTHCEDIFEIDFSITEQRPLIYCEKCKSPARRYIASAPPVKYNGTGFTTTEINRKSGLEDYAS